MEIVFASELDDPRAASPTRQVLQACYSHRILTDIIDEEGLNVAVANGMNMVIAVVVAVAAAVDGGEDGAPAVMTGTTGTGEKTGAEIGRGTGRLTTNLVEASVAPRASMVEVLQVDLTADPLLPRPMG